MGQRHRAEVGQDGDVEREIGQRHHGGTGQRAAGADVPLVEIQPHARGERTDRLDLVKASVVVDLRELPVDKGGHLVAGHHRAAGHE